MPAVIAGAPAVDADVLSSFIVPDDPSTLDSAVSVVYDVRDAAAVLTTRSDCVPIGDHEGTEATTVIAVEMVVVEVDFWQPLELEHVESTLTALIVAVVVS